MARAYREGIKKKKKKGSNLLHFSNFIFSFPFREEHISIQRIERDGSKKGHVQYAACIFQLPVSESKKIEYMDGVFAEDAICFMRNLNASHVQHVSMLSLHLAVRMELKVLAVSSESRVISQLEFLQSNFLLLA